MALQEVAEADGIGSEKDALGAVGRIGGMNEEKVADARHAKPAAPDLPAALKQSRVTQRLEQFLLEQVFGERKTPAEDASRVPRSRHLGPRDDAAMGFRRDRSEVVTLLVKRLQQTQRGGLSEAEGGYGLLQSSAR